jgi:hypothetical protein
MRIFSQEILKILVLNAIVNDLHLVIIALNIVVHIRPGRRSGIAIGIPHIHNLFSGHLIVFVGWVILVFATADDLLDDFIGIKFGEMVVVPSSDGSIRFVAVDGVDVGRLFKLDESIAWMCVEFG